MNLMLDIEGMNKLPHAHRTRIMEVAIAAFDCFGVLDVPTFHEFLNSSRPSWTQDEPSTREFWTAQPIWQDMLRNQSAHGITPKDLCLKLNEYINSLQEVHGKVTIWACHPEYDITALYSYMSAIGITPAWRFNQVKDYATVRDQFKEAIQSPPVTHWAHEDVLRQIDIMSQCCKLGWQL